jgi:hypothetical protein
MFFTLQNKFLLSHLKPNILLFLLWKTKFFFNPNLTDVWCLINILITLFSEKGAWLLGWKFDIVPYLIIEMVEMSH